MGRQHNATLDGLRGVAATIVIWYHLVIETYGMLIPCRGYLAVDFFFILSGFVMAHAYERKLRAELSLGEFLKRRLIRLYPMIFLGIAGWCLVYALAGVLAGHYLFPLSTLAAALAFGMFMLPAFGVGNLGLLSPVNDPLWSLLFEFWVNLVYGVAATRRALGAIVPLAMIAGAVGLIISVIQRGQIFGGFDFATFWVGAARVGYGFFVGVLLQRWCTPARLARLPNVPFSLLAVILLITLLASPRLTPAYDLFAVFVVFPVIVVLGAKDAISPRLRSLALQTGGLTYPLYALHWGVVTAIAWHIGHPRPLVAVTIFTLTFAAMVVVSAGVFFWIDEPVRAWLTRQTRAARPAVAAPAPAERADLSHAALRAPLG